MRELLFLNFPTSQLLVFLFLLLLASPAYALISVHDLKHICFSTRDEDQVGCRLYILGVADGVDLESRLSGKSHFCVPQGITTVKLEGIIKGTINEDLVLHPTDNNMPAVSFIGAVFARFFPCPKYVPIPGSGDPVLKNYPNADMPSTADQTPDANPSDTPKSLTDGYQLVTPPSGTIPPADSQPSGGTIQPADNQR